jgi:hypothetical protein
MCEPPWFGPIDFGKPYGPRAGLTTVKQLYQQLGNPALQIQEHQVRRLPGDRGLSVEDPG